MDQCSYLWSKFYVWGGLFSKLPYCRLRNSSTHKFGRLRLWPKAKSINKDLKCWAELKWRPLVSYSAHHWSRLFSLGARWCCYIINVFNLGFHIQSPKAVISRVNAFNAGRSRDAAGVRSDLNVDLLDLKDFFTNVPREEVRRIVRKYIRLVRERMPESPWF